jgi:hypothetical protein
MIGRGLLFAGKIRETNYRASSRPRRRLGGG